MSGHTTRSRRQTLTTYKSATSASAKVAMVAISWPVSLTAPSIPAELTGAMPMSDHRGTAVGRVAFGDLLPPQAFLDARPFAVLVLLAEQLEHRPCRVAPRHAADPRHWMSTGAREEEARDGRAVSAEPEGGLGRAEPGQDRIDVVHAAVHGMEALLDVGQAKRAPADLELFQTLVVVLGVAQDRRLDLIPGDIPPHGGVRRREAAPKPPGLVPLRSHARIECGRGLAQPRHVLWDLAADRCRLRLQRLLVGVVRVAAETEVHPVATPLLVFGHPDLAPERDVDLHIGKSAAAGRDVGRPILQLAVEHTGRQQPVECLLGGERGQDSAPREQLLAVVQPDASDLPLADDELVDLRVRPDAAAVVLEAPDQRGWERAGSAMEHGDAVLREDPKVDQRPRRRVLLVLHEGQADHERRLDDVGLEPLLDRLGLRHGRPADDLADLPRVTPSRLGSLQECSRLRVNRIGLHHG